MDDNHEIQEDSFLSRVTSVANEFERRRLDIMARVNQAYVRTKRDGVLAATVKTVIEWAATNKEGSITLVLGEARVGKTKSLERALKARSELQPDGYYLPYIQVSAPNPCGHKQLGREILHACEYDIEKDIPDHLIWEKVRRHIRKRHVRIIWIDEMHHTLRGTDIQRLRDTIKNTMQQPDWSVQFILSGIPMLKDFVAEDFQIKGRNELVVNLNLLEMPGNARIIKETVREIIIDHAGLKLSHTIETDEFINRLAHAACLRFGLIIMLTRRAIDKALQEPQSNHIGIEHFVLAYQAFTGCIPAQNVFVADRWDLIRPENALLDRYNESTDEDIPPQRLKKSGGRS